MYSIYYTMYSVLIIISLYSFNEKHFLVNLIFHNRNIIEI